MTSVEDFTVLTLGAEVSMEGRVSCCPRCGRNGVEERRGDGPSCYVIHVQVSRVLGDGMLTEPSDFCVLPESNVDDSDDGAERKPARPASISLDRPPARA